MSEDYAMKDDIKKLEERLYGHQPPFFENDIGDLGHIRKQLDNVEKQQAEILGWKKRLSGVPAKIVMVVSFLGMVMAGLNALFNLMGH